MKKLLILGGARYIIPAIQAAHDLGVYVISCDYLPDNIGHTYSDEYRNVSIIEKDAVLALAKELKIDGILSFATDPGVETAAYVAEQLGLPTSPYESVHILQNKNLFRAFLKEYGFNVPWFKYYSCISDALKDAGAYEFPVIVKPVDSAGSKGVRRVNRKEELEGAIRYALSYSHSDRFIIEEFIQQVGYASDTDCFSINDELVFASFSCQHFDAEAENPYTPAGYTWPSDMPTHAQRELRNELQRLIRLLHMGTSIYNVECRMGTNGRAYLMEVSPRAGGNRLAEVLRYACGQDLIRNNVKAALGMPLDELHDPVYTGAWAELIVHSETAGKFAGVWIAPEIAEKNVVEKDIWVQPGDLVKAFTGANETIGTIILKFASHDEAEQMMSHPEQWVKVMVDVETEKRNGGGVIALHNSGNITVSFIAELVQLAA